MRALTTQHVEPARDVRGVSVPAFLYGTAWKEERTKALVLRAFEAEFRGFDTANQRRHYVEADVGEAVAEIVDGGRARREDIFLQTKYTYARGQDHRLPYDASAPFAAQVRQSLESSLSHLRVTYVDSLVLHGPETLRAVTDADVEVWKAMEELWREKRARLLGVSNVSLGQLRAFSETARVPLAFVQNRCFARTGWDREVRAFAASRGIVYQAFSLLTANERELRLPAVRAMAARHGRSVEQVAFRFALQAGMLPLTGSSSLEHLRADLDCFEFELSPAEVSTIERISG